MTTQQIDTLVIGAGQAGLNTSRALQMADIDHVVIERGRIGESWASQRWDSFRLNTPNWANGLLGFAYDGQARDGFMSAAELRDLMVAFVDHFELPVQEGTEVCGVRRTDGGFDVELSDGTVRGCRNVVICSGAQNVPRMPDLAKRIHDVTQLHASDYRRPDQLPAGGVLIIGGGQSGAQIAEELAAAGRDTYLSTSSVGSVPRRYRGRDIAEWMVELGVTDTPVESLDDPSQRYATQPLMTGAEGGHTMTLHGLARRGVTLLGRLRDTDGTTLRFDDDLAANSAKGLAAMAEVCAAVDRFITAAAIDAPEAEPDDGAQIADELDEMCQLLEIDLTELGIGTVLWATGFGGDFSYLDVEITVDDHGIPVQSGGASEVDGLWFCGFPWLRVQASGLIHGSAGDAKAIVDQIVAANAVRPSLTPVTT
jgi:putative flavoprotein involved in K+ transport